MGDGEEVATRTAPMVAYERKIFGDLRHGFDSRSCRPLVAASSSLFRRVQAALVLRTQAHHRSLVDTLERLAAAHRVPDVAVYSDGMFNPAPVTSVAWQAARESGALANLPLAVVLGIAPIYETQE